MVFIFFGVMVVFWVFVVIVVWGKVLLGRIMFFVYNVLILYVYSLL